MTSNEQLAPQGLRAEPDIAERLVSWTVKYRVWITALCLGLTLAGLAGALRSGFDTDVRAYFGSDNPDLVALETMETRHGRYNSAVLLLAPRGGTVFSAAVLDAINKTTRRLRAIADVAGAQSLSNLRSLGEIPGWTLNDPLLDPERPATADKAAFVQATVQKIQHRTGTLVSKSGHVAAINMLVRVHDGSPEKALAAVAALRDLKASLSSEYPAIDFYLTGSAVMDATFMDAIRNDLVYLVPFQVVAIVGLLLICLQSVLVAGVLLMVLAVTCAVTMGLAGWLGHDLNGVTSATPMVLMGLAIATSIHLLLSWQQALRNGSDQIAALKLSVRINLFPIFLAALTTAVSFLCLNFSDSPPFRQLGNLVAVGITVTFVLAFTLLPALTSFLPPKSAPNNMRIEVAMGRFGAWVTRSRALLIVLFAVTALTSGWGVNRLVFDDNFAHYFSESYEFRRSTDFFEKNLSGLTAIDFSIPAKKGVSDPGYLNNLNGFADWLRGQQKVVFVTSIAGIIKAAAAAVPFLETSNGLPKTAFGSEMIFGFIRPHLAENAPPGRPLNSGETYSLVTVILSDASSSEIRDFSAAAETWLAREMPAMAAPATGMPLLAANMSARNTRAMVAGTIVALILVSLILLIALRSVAMGLISLIPNLMPMIMAYGLWGLAFGEVSFAATVVSAMTFGIVVDDTVHFLWKYRYARNELGLSPAKAVPHAFSTVGVAILVTTLAIISGFAALAFSGFLVNAHLGLLTVMTLSAALLAVLLFLPTFLLVLERRNA